MPQILTFWEDPPVKRSPNDFDGILEVRIKRVKEIPELIAHMPKRTVMISLEYSAPHMKGGKVTCPTNPTRFRELWRRGQPIPQKLSDKCPLCGCKKGEGA